MASRLIGGPWVPWLVLQILTSRYLVFSVWELERGVVSQMFCVKLMLHLIKKKLGWILEWRDSSSEVTTWWLWKSNESWFGGRQIPPREWWRQKMWIFSMRTSGREKKKWPQWTFNRRHFVGLRSWVLDVEFPRERAQKTLLCSSTFTQWHVFFYFRMNLFPLEPPKIFTMTHVLPQLSSI